MVLSCRRQSRLNGTGTGVTCSNTLLHVGVWPYAASTEQYYSLLNVGSDIKLSNKEREVVNKYAAS